MKRQLVMVLFAATVLALEGCAAPKIKLFTDETEPLQEFTLQGEAREKILVVPVKGLIVDEPRREFLRPKPSIVQEIVSQLQLAETDKDIRTLLLKVHSPGGSITASDILYHELKAFKERTHVKIVVVMMDLATSGAYYISLPADVIVAHPTTVTGSVGVIFLRPQITALMDKIGIRVQVNKSGENKDMASPFRAATAEEERIFQGLTDAMGDRFIRLVAENRKLSPAAAQRVATARVYLAGEALELGLIDEIGYLNDAIRRAKEISKLPENARVVVYRRTEYPDDNLYNPEASLPGIQRSPQFPFDLPEQLAQLQSGFYYLWFPGGSP